ncbi:thiamine diphosphokinase [Candidatus Woesearchaeota archaeon]|nr:thiamine diphosphokinase [Candidatus Woesearchaeota archaeon]
MRILIVANGRIKDKEFYKKIKADKILAADGGADNCIRLGITPDKVIGDMDSISKKAKELFKDRLFHDSDQNSTDLQKCIHYSKQYKVSEYIIIGAIGRRIDHTLGNIMVLDELEHPATILDEHNNIYMVKDSIELKGKKGDIVSIIAISDIEGLAYKGLKWIVTNREAEAGWTGTCNEMNAKNASISLKKGKILVIQARD